MQMDRFTTLAQEVLSNAQSLATGRSHGELTPLHILTAMVEDRNGVASSILAKAGLQAERIRDVAEAELGRRPQATGTQPRTANATMEVLQRAEREAKERKDAYVSTEHLLLGLMEVPGDAREVLESCGANRAAIDAAIDGIRKASGVSQVNDPDAESNFEALKKYAIDLNERAAAGKIDPVIGRDEEIRRCMQVLSRRTKNNPVLIGEPGVGKTAIAEGLAIRIVDHDCPEGMRSARIMALDVGTAPRGREVPGRVRGATQGRPARSRRRGRFDHPLHRRIAHHRRGRPGRRRGQRRQPAQARAGAGRTPMHRRDDARRVSQAHREGRRLRPAFPAGAGGRAERRGHHRDSSWTQAPIRGASRRPDPGRCAGERGPSQRSIHQRSIPAGQGHRSARRGEFEAPDRERLDADRAGRTASSDHAAGDRAGGPEAGEPEGSGRSEAARRDRRGTRVPGGAQPGAHREVGDREGGSRRDQGGQGGDRSKADRARAGEAPRRLRGREPHPVRGPSATRRTARRGGTGAARTRGGGRRDGEGGGRQRDDRRGHRPLDRNSGGPSGRG